MLKIEKSKFTRRAVLYIGFKCNLRCRFCYYADDHSKQWHSLDVCKKNAHIFRNIHRNRFVDITGGEPTIHPDIIPLVEYCREIGLKPTIITNMQALSDLDSAEKFKRAGIEDFLCSVHNLGVAYDEIVGVAGSFSRAEKTLDNLVFLGVPFRTNITVNATNFKNLKGITEFVYSKGCRVINYISCNLFGTHEETFNLLAQFSEIKGCLREALDYCKASGMRAAVRYMPFCFLGGYEDVCYNYHQLPYDCYEWDYKSWSHPGVIAPAPKVSADSYSSKNDQEAYQYLAGVFCGNNYTYPAQCNSCKLSKICDGVNRNYIKKFGTNEFVPFEGNKIIRPDYFINA